MSESDIRQLQNYENSLLGFLKSHGNAFDVRQFPVEFPQKYGPNIVGEVFGTDFSALKNYADLTLANLPKTAATRFISTDALFEINVGQKVARLLENGHEQLEGLETSLVLTRFWDPRVFVQTAASMALAQSGSPEDAARNALYGSFVKPDLSKSMINGKEVLVFSTGVRTFLVHFVRTPRGMFLMTSVSAYERH